MCADLGMCIHSHSQFTPPAALIQLHRRGVAALATVLEGLCLYLDVTAPTLPSVPSAETAWQLLSQIIVEQSTLLSTLRERYDTAIQQFRSAQQAAEGIVLLGEEAEAAELEPAAAGALAAQQELHAALAVWRGCLEIMHDRLWWLDCHLRLPEPQHLEDAAAQVGDHGFLIHRAIAAALLLSLRADGHKQKPRWVCDARLACCVTAPPGELPIGMAYLCAATHRNPITGSLSVVSGRTKMMS